MSSTYMQLHLSLCGGHKTLTLRVFQMMSLVSKYHGDLVGTTHIHLAHECESQGNYRAAENHFVQAGEWKLAVKMYRSLDMWEEAYKVCVLVYYYFYTICLACKYVKAFLDLNGRAGMNKSDLFNCVTHRLGDKRSKLGVLKLFKVIFRKF